MVKRKGEGWARETSGEVRKGVEGVAQAQEVIEGHAMSKRGLVGNDGLRGFRVSQTSEHPPPLAKRKM